MAGQNSNSVQIGSTDDDTGFPHDGPITSIEQIARRGEWIDNIILDSCGWIAASLDQLQQGVMLVTSMTLQTIGKTIKKRMQDVGRTISKVQKTVDASQFQDTMLPIGDKVTLDSNMAEAPVEIEDIKGNNPSAPTVIPNPPIPSNGCVLGTTRIDPVTCEKSICGPNGIWLPMGIYDQACLDANKPPPDCPPNLHKNAQGLCVPDVSTGICGYLDKFGMVGNEPTYHVNVSYICGGNLATEAHVTNLESAAAILKGGGLGLTFELATSTSYRYDQINPANQSSDFGANYFVSVPMARNSYNKSSIYTDQGENIFREWLVDSNLVEMAGKSTTYNSFITDQFTLYDYDSGSFVLDNKYPSTYV